MFIQQPIRFSDKQISSINKNFLRHVKLFPLVCVQQKKTAMIKETYDSLPKRENHFTVPEGYFDTLAERVMEHIPENEVRMMPMPVHKPLNVKRWRTVAAAAVVLAAVFGAGLYVHQDFNGAAVEAMATQRSSYTAADGSIDAVADYIMCDDDDLYAYLADE